MKRVFSQNNIRSIIAVITAAMFVLLSGCAVIPDNWIFTKEIRNIDQDTKIERIALVDVPVPSQIILGDEFSDTAVNLFGMVGMLTVEDTEGNKIINGAFLSSKTRETLQGHLEEDGVEVVLLDAQRKDPSEMLEDYSQFTGVDADAILEVAFVRVGYAKRIAFGADELGPQVIYKYRLLSAKDRRVLIESNIFYEPFMYKTDSAVTGYRIYGSLADTFEDEDALKEDPEEAARRLVGAIEEATQKISLFVSI